MHRICIGRRCSAIRFGDTNWIEGLRIEGHVCSMYPCVQVGSEHQCGDNKLDSESDWMSEHILDSEHRVSESDAMREQILVSESDWLQVSSDSPASSASAASSDSSGSSAGNKLLLLCFMRRIQCARACR